MWQVLYKQAPAIAYLLTHELGIASASWQKLDREPNSSVLYTLRLQD